MMIQDGSLQWVVVENELRHVSEFAHLAPKLRPPSSCPVCERPVVMKLGKQKIHHAAHSPDSTCVLTNPETAVHFNAKIYIAKQLDEANNKKLYLPQTCLSCHNSQRDALWVQDWNDVKVERRLDNDLQPDIQLLKQEEVVAAIEVFVTHSVDYTKAEKLQSIGLPWVEIKGKPELYVGDEVWHISQPLPVFRTNHVFDEAWLCKKCVTRKEETERKQEWLKNNGLKSLECKLVDFFYPFGRWMRNLFIIECMLDEGEPIIFELKRFRTSLNYDRIKYCEEKEHIIATIFPPFDDAETVIYELKEKGREFLRAMKKEKGVILDSPMPWIDKGPTSLESCHLGNFPRRYYFNKKTKQWFIPADRKSVIWFDEEGHPSRELTY
jgi:hypothetical protein